MFHVKIKYGKYKGYNGVVHELNIKDRFKNGKVLITVQVEDPVEGFPFKDYSYKQIEIIDNPNESY